MFSSLISLLFQHSSFNRGSCLCPHLSFARSVFTLRPQIGDGTDQISEIESLRHVKGIEYHHVKCHRVVIKYYIIYNKTINSHFLNPSSLPQGLAHFLFHIYFIQEQAYNLLVSLFQLHFVLLHARPSIILQLPPTRCIPQLLLQPLVLCL